MKLSDMYRALVNPRARRTLSTAIVHSGGRQTRYDCVCGSTHSEATRYRGQSRHYQDWCSEHADCMARAVEKALPLCTYGIGIGGAS